LAIYPADGIRGDPPCLKGGAVRIDLGVVLLRTCVFIAEITDELILVLDILLVHSVSMVLG
jgi:hypothetical protein